MKTLAFKLFIREKFMTENGDIFPWVATLWTFIYYRGSNLSITDKYNFYFTNASWVPSLEILSLKLRFLAAAELNFYSDTMLYSQWAWMHLRCISETSHTASQRRLKDVSKRADLQISETSCWRLVKDVSSETSLRSLRFSQGRLWVPSERL